MIIYTFVLTLTLKEVSCCSPLVLQRLKLNSVEEFGKAENAYKYLSTKKSSNIKFINNLSLKGSSRTSIAVSFHTKRDNAFLPVNIDRFT